MFSILRKLINKYRSPERFHLIEKSINQYQDNNNGRWRWVLIEQFAFCGDPDQNCCLVLEKHSRPLSKTISYEDAMSQSQSFSGKFYDIIMCHNIIEKEHYGLPTNNSDECVSCTKWILSDGSFLKEIAAVVVMKYICNYIKY